MCMPSLKLFMDKDDLWANTQIRLSRFNNQI